MFSRFISVISTGRNGEKAGTRRVCRADASCRLRSRSRFRWLRRADARWTSQLRSPCRWRYSNGEAVKQLRKSERGVALLAVLLGVALMTLIVVDFAMTSGLGFVSAANQANELRASYLARSAVNIGLALLAADARADAKSPTPTDTLSDVWAVPFPPMQLEGGTVSLSIVDEGRKINLNAMVQNGAPNQVAMLKVQRLFTVLDVSPDLVQGINDWITPNNGTGLGGGIGDYYSGLKPPYQPRYGSMPTMGDLQMVKGFNEAIFNRLSPFLTVMPETAVNANTASPQVPPPLDP